MSVIFLSYFLREDTPAYGGAEGTLMFEQIRSIDRGDTSNNLFLKFPNHIGTHIDFPRHFSNEGKSINDYPAEFWIFNRVGFIHSDMDSLELSCKGLPDDIELLIVKTGFGDQRNENIYWAGQPVVPASAAEMLRKRFPHLRVFGFDLISLTSQLNKAEGKKAHLAFLTEQNILVLEDMNLNNLFSTPERVIIAPLQISNADGVPCTVIAF